MTVPEIANLAVALARAAMAAVAVVLAMGRTLVLKIGARRESRSSN